ncbi:MAG TPA: 3-hydroxyisobutyryl-CoA hydrolase [Cryobacterium sp.]|nr:3-hydroxyisobutyryl-CoA hydrolase [Cryobacterium sp.]
MLEFKDDRPDILLHRDGRLAQIILNRPAALNALTHAMIRRMSAVLTDWAADGQVETVLLTGSGDRGLCAGGDIVAIYRGDADVDDAARANADAEAAGFFADEYHLNAQIHRYPKPYVAVMDGVVLGGGIGVSGHANTRIVTERTRLGMPETAIGFVPDVGGTWLLSHAPGELGTHLALTSDLASGSDAIALGLADHFVPSDRLPALARALAGAGAAEAVRALAETPPPSALLAQRHWIDECYAFDDVGEIVAALQRSPVEAARDAAALILTRSPTALAVTLAALRRARRLPSLGAALDQEYRVTLRFLARSELQEGIRAQVIDKDRNPRWSPASLGEVTPASVAAFFAPLGEQELGLGPEEPPYVDADLIFVTELLTPDERARLAAARAFYQAEVRPLAVDYWNRAEFPFELLPRLAAQNLAGQNLAATGAAATSHLLTGLLQMELTRADTSISTFYGVHHELFAAAVDQLGSPEQRERLLPGLLALEKIGAFALTEPEHGSDISRMMETTATRHGDEWVLNGTKRWIGNGAMADYVLVWARDTADRQIKGFIVERERPGFTATPIENKIAVRIVQNADITLTDVRIPYTNWLPGSRSFQDTNVLLRNSRVWVSWQAVGQQFAAFDVARAYALERRQFGVPIASFQLVQEQLSRMIGNATLSLSLMVQMARLQESGRLTMDQAALAKAACTTRMRETVALGRGLLGGNGISTRYEMAKIFADAEAIYSYEGSYEINALLVGRAVTGISAFD